LSKKSFNPIGVPMLLAAGSGSSMEGTIRPGEDGGTPTSGYKSVGFFDVEDYGYCEVFLNLNGEGADDDNYYICDTEGNYYEVGWDGDWAGRGY